MRPSLPDLVSTKGLSSSEAGARLLRDGYNELPSEKPLNPFKIALEVVCDPIFLLLLASGVLYLFLGDIQEAFMLLGFVGFIMVIGLYQEIKTEKALEALRGLSSPRALVIRDGEPLRVPGREVVRGDILILTEGDRVAADARILQSGHLTADESLLTGESLPVSKSEWDGARKPGRPGGENLPFIYSGSLVIQGKAIAEVIATGAETEIGKIGKALQGVDDHKTPLQLETGRLVRRLAFLGGALCFIVVLAYGWMRQDWLAGLLAGIALAMAILPNEFPVVLTVFLALGAWRISKKKVLTRRIPAVENLGAVSVLCVDKTGTLTRNQMIVKKLYAAERVYDLEKNSKEPLPEDFHLVAEFGILASQRDPFDPVEKAILEIGETYLTGTEHIHHNWKLVRQYPLSSRLMALSHVWTSPDGRDFVIGAKGAPEAIFDLCHLSPEQIKPYLEQVSAFAREGLRILGVARSSFQKTHLPSEQHDFNFDFLGLIAFSDPIRGEVPAAIKECYEAGIRVVMMTGDYPATACNIAGQVGLRHSDQFISGSELERMSDADLKLKIQSVNVFARVVPEQKLRLIRALKANGEVVVMTGDGVNDAPALKAADIGIAMGKRGTDVAREAAQLVLVEDDFSSIVEAVKVGRRIFDNLRKAMSYLLAIHVPIAGMSLIPVLLKWPLVLMPIHIAFLHLIIDPVCSVVFEMEPAHADTMRRPPRPVNEPLFNGPLFIIALVQGSSILLVNALAFGWVLALGLGEAAARTAMFVTLIAANLSLIWIGRTILKKKGTHSNPAVHWVTWGTVAAMFAVLIFPELRNLFRFSPLEPVILLACAVAGAGSVLWPEGARHIFRNIKNA